MFDALANLSQIIPDAYNRASEFKDLHLGDVHLLRVNGRLSVLPVLQFLLPVLVLISERSRNCLKNYLYAFETYLSLCRELQ